MTGANKLLVWLRGEVKTPPFSKAARVEAGFLLRRMQAGEKLSLPWSRPMPSIGTRCHELRITDKETIWRIVYRLDLDAILIVEVFQKKTQQTPKHVIDTCKKRLRLYDDLTR
jgi:phage-related protein